MVGPLKSLWAGVNCSKNGSRIAVEFSRERGKNEQMINVTTLFLTSRRMNPFPILHSIHRQFYHKPRTCKKTFRRLHLCRILRSNKAFRRKRRRPRIRLCTGNRRCTFSRRSRWRCYPPTAAWSPRGEYYPCTPWIPPWCRSGRDKFRALPPRNRSVIQLLRRNGKIGFIHGRMFVLCQSFPPEWR